MVRNAQKSFTEYRTEACLWRFLDFRREFCPWIGFCVVTGYKQVRAGKIKITKVGRKSVVAAQDAIAYRDALCGIAA